MNPTITLLLAVTVLPNHRDDNYGKTPTSDTHMLEIIDSRGVTGHD